MKEEQVLTTSPALSNETQPRELTLSERIGAYHPDGTVKYLNGIIFGEPGAGKTFLFGTVEEDPANWLPALVLDIDGGTDTIRNRHKIEVSPPIRSLASLTKIYNEIAAEPGYYKSICIDNGSELQKIDMNEVMKEAKATANNPEKVDIYVPSQREWGKSAERMRIVIRGFRDLPCHTIMILHSDDREDKTTGINRIWPQLPGQLRTGASGFFSIAGYMSVYEENGVPHRQIQFAKTRRVAAKDRFQVLPDVMKPDPTLPQIWKMIQDSGAKLVPQNEDALSALKAATTN